MSEALVGLLGIILGFLFGLIGTEFKAWRDRGRRKADVAGLLRGEISSNKSRVERTIDIGRMAKDKGKVARYLISPFMRDGYSSCVGDLVLLPRDTWEAVQLFYARLVAIEFIVSEGYLRQALIVPSEKKSLDEVWKRLQDEIDETANRALEAADEALAGLEKLAD